MAFIYSDQPDFEMRKNNILPVFWNFFQRINETNISKRKIKAELNQLVNNVSVIVAERNLQYFIERTSKESAKKIFEKKIHELFIVPKYTEKKAETENVTTDQQKATQLRKNKMLIRGEKKIEYLYQALIRGYNKQMGNLTVNDFVGKRKMIELSLKSIEQEIKEWEPILQEKIAKGTDITNNGMAESRVFACEKFKDFLLDRQKEIDSPKQPKLKSKVTNKVKSTFMDCMQKGINMKMAFNPEDGVQFIHRYASGDHSNYVWRFEQNLSHIKNNNTLLKKTIEKDLEEALSDLKQNEYRNTILDESLLDKDKLLSSLTDVLETNNHFNESQIIEFYEANISRLKKIKKVEYLQSQLEPHQNKTNGRLSNENIFEDYLANFNINKIQPLLTKHIKGNPEDLAVLSFAFGLKDIKPRTELYEAINNTFQTNHIRQTIEYHFRQCENTQDSKKQTKIKSIKKQIHDLTKN